MMIKNIVIDIREKIASHISNKYLRKLLYGLLSYEMINYIFFGFFTAIIDYATFFLLSHSGMNELLANIVSWTCAVIFSFTTNRRFVFKMGFDNKMELIRSFKHFLYARLSTLIMTEVMIFTAQLLAINIYYVKIAAMICTVIINYILSKLIIFNKKL